MATKKVVVKDEASWQEPIINIITDATRSGLSPTKGDRYLLSDGANINKICYYNSVSWVYLTPLEGCIIWNNNDNLYYKYNGSTWGLLDFVKNDGTVNQNNLLYNGDFENWSAGTAAAPDGWTLDNGAVAREASIINLGTYSAKLTKSAANANFYQNIGLTKGIAYWKNKTVTYGCWVYATVASRARIALEDGLGYTYSSYHTGGSTWEWLTVTKTISNTASYVLCFNFVDTGNTSAYFDGAMCVEGSSAFAFADKPAGDGVWADYSATSTIVGWSSIASKTIYIKKIGKTIFVSYNITGTSDNVATSFTVPYTIATPSSTAFGYAVNNGGVAVIGIIAAFAGGVIIGLYSTVAYGAWTNSGTKTVAGQLWFESV
jgi:hypothetical protein